MDTPIIHMTHSKTNETILRHLIYCFHALSSLKNLLEVILFPLSGRGEKEEKMTKKKKIRLLGNYE